MIVFFIFGFFIFFFSILSSLTKKKEYLLCSFFLIFLFQALRYNYGNDYISYKNIFIEINENDLFETRYEIGWVLLNKLFYYLGFEILIAFIALFTSIVYYKFISLYVSPKYYWLSVFLFFFDPNNLLINVTAIRQSVAISFFLLSIIKLDHKYKIASFILLLTATIFHSSSIIIFPILFFIFFFNKIFLNRKIYKFLLLAVYISFFYISDFLKDYIPLLSTFLMNGKYDSYATPSEINVTSLFNVTFYSYIFYTIMQYSYLELRGKSHLFSLAIVGLIFIPFALIIPLIARFSYYFLPFLIVLVPIIYDHVKNFLTRNVFLWVIIVVTLIRMFRFFNSDTYYLGFYEYHSIFEKWN